MIKYIIKPILYTALLLLTVSLGYAQEKNTKNPLKKFAVKVYGVYSVSQEQSKLQIVGGKYDMGNSPTSGLSVAWYYNKNWSAALSASTGKYSMDMVEGNYPNMKIYRYELSVGNVWIAPISLSVRYHLTKFNKIVPYALAGGSYTLFTNADPGWGADKVTYQNTWALHFGIGADYNITDRWFINAEVRKFFSNRSTVDLDFSKTMNWQIKTQVQPNLLNFTAGFGYRF